MTQSRFRQFLGVQVRSSGDGAAHVALPSKEEIINIRGDVHGGAIATILDAAMATAARSTVPPEQQVATASMTVNYLSPGRGELNAIAKVVRSGRTLISVEAHVEDSKGQTVAHAVGLFRVVRAPRPD